MGSVMSGCDDHWSSSKLNRSLIIFGGCRFVDNSRSRGSDDSYPVSREEAVSQARILQQTDDTSYTHNEGNKDNYQ